MTLNLQTSHVQSDHYCKVSLYKMKENIEAGSKSGQLDNHNEDKTTFHLYKRDVMVFMNTVKYQYYLTINIYLMITFSK